MLTALRRRLGRRLPAAVAVLALAAASVVAMTAKAPAAHADGCTYITVSRDGTTICWINGQQGGGGGGGDGNGVSIKCDAAGNIVWDGQTYKCAIDGWSFSGGCYIQPVVPQPASNDPIWGSSDPSTNRAQWEDCDHTTTKNPPTLVGAKEIIGPCVGYCAGVNPVELITKELQIDKPDLGMSPPGGPGAIGFVNQNIWFWTKGLDMTSQTRSAGNVVGTRTFNSIQWTITRAGHTTPDTTLSCQTDIEYSPSDGAEPSKDSNCRYQFTAPDTYTISVTTSWTLVITQNGGAPDVQPITSAPNTTTIKITEGQSTNQQSSSAPPTA